MKQAYYFPHDSNAKDDHKCVLLIEQLGCEGYGIFWILVETLRDQPDFKYPLNLIPALARRYNTTFEKMKAVILKYNLFQIENDQFFYSESLINRMGEIANKRLKQSEGGKQAMLKRWKSEKSKLQNDNLVISNLQETYNQVITSKGKESKEKEIKEKKNFKAPTSEEVKTYFTEKGYTVDSSKRFFDYYTELGWHDSSGKKIINWKAKAQAVWFKDENRIKTDTKIKEINFNF